MDQFDSYTNLRGYLQQVKPDRLHTPAMSHRVFERTYIHPDYPEQLISQTAQHQAEEVGAESMTTQPVGETHILDLLDPVLSGFAPLGIKIPVQFLRVFIGEVAGKEANVHSFTGGFNLGIQILRAGPGISLVGERSHKGLERLVKLGVFFLNYFKQGTDNLLQTVIACHTNTKIQAEFFNQFVKVRTRELGISTDNDLDIREPGSQCLNDRTHDAMVPFGGMNIPGPENRKNHLSGLSVDVEQFIEHPLPVISMKKASLLTSVRRIVRAVHVDHHMLLVGRKILDIPVDPPKAQLIKVRHPEPILQAGHRGLTAKAFRKQTLKNRVFPEIRQIVGVLVAHGQQQDLRLNQLFQAKINIPGIPGIMKRLTEAVDNLGFAH